MLSLESGVFHRKVGEKKACYSLAVNNQPQKRTTQNNVDSRCLLSSLCGIFYLVHTKARHLISKHGVLISRCYHSVQNPLNPIEMSRIY